MMKFLVSIFIFVAASIAVANTNQPQFYYQPEEGQFALTPGVSLARRNSQIQGFIKTEVDARVIGIEGEYGISESFAIGFDQSFISTTEDFGGTENEYSGLGDFGVQFKGNHKINDNFTFRFGSLLSFGSTAEVDSNGDRDNQYSGRNEITPYIGFDYRVEKSVFGARLSQEILIGDQVTEDPNGNERKTTGGNDTTFEAFFEKYFDNAGVGGTLLYAVTTDVDIKGGGTIESIDLFGLGVYGIFFLSEEITFVPGMAYVTTPDDSVAGIEIEEFNIIALTADVRFTF